MSDATYETRRRCPYCGESVRLSECPIVATNYEGVEFRAATELELAEVELPSGQAPLRLLPQTFWPVVAEAPAVREERDAASGGQSPFEQAFGSFKRGGPEKELPPVAEEEGVAREDLPARACTGCWFPLPTTIDSRPAVVVAVVGVNRVGKTHLLASSLTRAYRSDGLQSIGCTEFVPDEETGHRFMEDYFNPLFRRGEVLSATAAEDDEVRFKPLVFNVRLDGIEPFSLLIHDVAGEVLGDRRKRALGATYLRAARGAVLVVDPRDIDNLRSGLPNWMLEDNELGWDQGALLSACLRSDGLLDHRTPIPVAVTVTKADLLPTASGESPPFMAPAPPVEDREEFITRVRSSSREVEDFLDRHGAHHLLGPIREYRRSLDGQSTAVTFHAVSALGKAPDSEERLTAKVDPLNCLDPLATVLAQLAWG
jgi:hypothetical protein